MDTRVLDKCANTVMSFSIKEYGSILDLTIELIAPFHNELYKNLLKGSKQDKQNVVKFYITSFPYDIIKVCSSQVNGFSSDKKNFKIVKSFIELREHSPSFDEIEIDLYLNYFFINKLLNIIGNACFENDLEFLELCKEMGFPIQCIEILNPKFIIQVEHRARIKASFLHCNNKIFECDFNTYLNGIVNADFSKINIKNRKKTKNQYLIFKISKLMHESWFPEICKNMGWQKEDCNRHESSLKKQPWIKQLDRIINESVADNQ